MGNEELIPWGFLLTYAASALPIKVSQPTSFLTFNVLPLSPIPLLQGPAVLGLVAIRG